MYLLVCRLNNDPLLLIGRLRMNAHIVYSAVCGNLVSNFIFTNFVLFVKQPTLALLFSLEVHAIFNFTGNYVHIECIGSSSDYKYS